MISCRDRNHDIKGLEVLLWQSKGKQFTKWAINLEQNAHLYKYWYVCCCLLKVSMLADKQHISVEMLHQHLYGPMAFKWCNAAPKLFVKQWCRCLGHTQTLTHSQVMVISEAAKLWHYCCNFQQCEARFSESLGALYRLTDTQTNTYCLIFSPVDVIVPT